MRSNQKFDENLSSEISSIESEDIPDEMEYEYGNWQPQRRIQSKKVTG